MWRSAVNSVLSGLRGWQAIPVFVIALYVFLGVFGPTLAPFDPNRGTISDRLCPPLAIDALTIAPNPASRSADCSAAKILGTDNDGRDIFARLLHGARTSLSVVGPSVLIGTILGVAVGVWVNGLRHRNRLIAYLIVGATVLPFGFFVVSQPVAFLTFFWNLPLADFDDALRWSFIMSFSCVTALIALALIAVAYQFDERCLPQWINGAETRHGNSAIFSRFRQQVIALAPWIMLVVIASAGFILPHSSVYEILGDAWSFERDYLFEHVGMIGPVVPKILLPIAFVTLGTWWFIRHVLCRLTTTSDAGSAAIADVADYPQEPLPDEAVPNEDGSDPMEPQEPEIVHGRSFADLVAIVKLRRRLPVLVAIVAVLMIAQFAVYQAWPNVQNLNQDSAFSSEGYFALFWRETNLALTCARGVSSKLLSPSTRGQTPEERDLNPSQHCLDLYYERRNAPTHHVTFDFALRILSKTLTLALIGTAVATSLINFASGKTTPVRRAVQFVVGLIALTGLTITFGQTAWLAGIFHWIELPDVIGSDRSYAVRSVLAIFRDFSVALGIGFVIVGIVIAILHRARSVPRFDSASSWTSLLLPCVCLTAGLMVVFHYPFPSLQVIIDDQLAIIANPSGDHFYSSSHPYLGLFGFRDWLWTYWFALIGYAAMVFGFFAAAIWGFRRLVRSVVNGVDSTTVNPDSPSQDGDPT